MQKRVMKAKGDRKPADGMKKGFCARSGAKPFMMPSMFSFRGRGMPKWAKVKMKG